MSKIGTVHTTNGGEADIFFSRDGINITISQDGKELTITIEDIDEINSLIDEHLTDKKEK